MPQFPHVRMGVIVEFNTDGYYDDDNKGLAHGNSALFIFVTIISGLQMEKLMPNDDDICLLSLEIELFLYKDHIFTRYHDWIGIDDVNMIYFSFEHSFKY